MSRLKRPGVWVKRALWICAVPLTLVLLFAVIEHTRGRWMLSNRISALVASGEKVRVAELAPPRVEPGQNSVTDLLPLTNRVSLMMSNLGMLPPTGRFASPGKAVPGIKLTSWSYKEETNNWQRIHEMLAGDADLLNVVHEAMRKPGWDDGFDYHNGFIDFKAPPLVLWRQLSQLLHVAALNDLRHARTDEAVQRTVALLHLVRQQKQSRLVISELVRIACAAFAWHSTWEILQSQTCTEAQLARLQSAWGDMDFGRDMALAFEMERAMTLDQYDLITASKEKLAKAVDESESMVTFGMGASLPTSGFILRKVHVPFWRFAWARQDQLRALNRWQSVIEFDHAARKDSWSSVQAQVDAMDSGLVAFFSESESSDSEPLNYYDRLRFLFSNMSFSIGSSTTKKALQMETQRGLMVTAIALERYRLKHEGYPDDLSVLTPELLPQAAVDLMNGQPLRYRKDSATMFHLYSVGLDGKDDSGDPATAEQSEPYRNIWNGKDAVWPSPASLEEAEDVAHSK